MKISPDSHRDGRPRQRFNELSNCRIVDTALLSLGVQQFRKFLAEPLE